MQCSINCIRILCVDENIFSCTLKSNELHKRGKQNMSRNLNHRFRLQPTTEVKTYILLSSQQMKIKIEDTTKTKFNPIVEHFYSQCDWLLIEFHRFTWCVVNLYCRANDNDDWSKMSHDFCRLDNGILICKND